MGSTSAVRISTAGVARKGDTYFVAQRREGTSIGESWEFPGGKNRVYETPEETLVREYHEELNVEICVKDLIYEGSFSNKDKKYRLLAYAIEFIDEYPRFSLKEHQRIAWKTIEELQGLPMAESDRAVLDSLSDSHDRSH